jgi:hypothetical protein
MKVILSVAVAMALVALPATAGPRCAVSGTQKPMWVIARDFEEAGGRIREMKVNRGCYELYRTQGGTRVEMYFHTVSGAVLYRRID